jgi:putative ABC transport system substrate-binding protein
MTLRRREFVTLLGGAAAWPLAARAQEAKPPVVGFLRGDTPAAGASTVAAFRKGLSETGFVEGRNLVIEFRWAQNDRDRLSELAADLIRRKVDVIATPGSALGALAAKALTSTIPIVFSTNADPVQLGLVVSLNRPGGNVTGFTGMISELVPKQFGLLHELLPRATRFGLLVTRNFVAVDRVTRDAESAAAALGRRMEILFVASDRDIDAGFAELAQKRVAALLLTDDVLVQDDAGDIERAIVAFSREPNGALIVPPDNRAEKYRALIAALAAQHRLPAISSNRIFADAGGLMSYGSDQGESYRQVASYVDRILRGTKPSDLPIQAPTRFQFVFNLRAAKTLGLIIPPTLLAIADEVIE